MKLETVEFLWWLLLTKQARDPTAEFMVVLAEQDSLPSRGSSLLGARWGAGMFTQHLRPNSWGNCNHLILPCWLEEEFGYTARGRGFHSLSLALWVSSSLPFCKNLVFPPHVHYPPLAVSPFLLFFASKAKYCWRSFKTERNSLFLKPEGLLSQKICLWLN